MVIGCGSVGLCAILAALEYRPKCLFAVDSVPSRLEFSRKLGAYSLDLHSDVDQKIRQATQGRGADIVMELVGLQPALRLGFDLLRPGGVLVSLGVHHQEYPWTLAEGKLSLTVYLEMIVELLTITHKHIARICFFRWVDVLYDRFLNLRLTCS